MRIVCKIGETDVVLTVVLKNTDPTTKKLIPTDLADWSNIKMTVKRTDGVVIIDDLPCIPDVNQLSNPGKITTEAFDMTTAAYPNLIVGRHRVEFSGQQDNIAVRFFPMDEDDDETYGEFIVQESL